MSLLRVSSLSKTSIKPTAYISVTKERFPCHIFQLKRAEGRTRGGTVLLIDR